MTYKRILLVKPKGRKGLGFASDLIPIGLEYIAASIEYVVEEVHIIDMELEQRSFKYFLDLFRPDLVGITMSATDHNEGLRLAKIAKENGITTILGGYHPTLVPDELLSHPHVDMVVRGEGEHTIKELVQKGSAESVLGVSYKKDGNVIHNKDRPVIENLDSLPFPARHLRRQKYNNRMNNNDREIDVISTSRGCWGRCSFCCEPHMNRSLQRFRSPENVMEELLEVVSFHNGKPLQILVVDPNFMGNPETIDRLCDLLHKNKLDIRFSVMTRVDSVAKHPRLIKKMCDNGILDYELGIESPNLRDLKNTRKGITLEMQRKAMKILRDNGANVSGTFVIGLPGQTEEEIKQFPVYAKEIGLMNAAFGITTPFPGTEFHNNFDKKGLIVERDWTKYDEMHSVFRLNGMSRKRLEELQTYCMARFWTLNTFIDRVKVLRKRSDKKVSLEYFIEDIVGKVRFGRNAGCDLRKKEFENHLNAVLEAIVDAESEEKERKIDMHDVIEMSRFLGILGSQKIQCAFIYKEQPPVSYIIKTKSGSSGTVEYTKTVSGKQNDATINIDIDLNGAINSIDDNLSLILIRTCISLIKSARNVKGVWNVFRLFAAIGIDCAVTFLHENMKNKM
ncbi:radical SAM protein [Candidatus Bathyarchaeota archaeon]|nr:radical SAM protein [Candidatus Bathyarchaeota archaeon]